MWIHQSLWLYLNQFILELILVIIDKDGVLYKLLCSLWNWQFDLFLYYTAWICWHFNFAINVWDHKLLWYFIYKLWTLYNFCHAGCWHILLWIKKKMCCHRPVKWLFLNLFGAITLLTSVLSHMAVAWFKLT